MVAVYQDQFGEGGNCLAACVASILEISIEVLPDFHAIHASGESWWNALVWTLRGRGWEVVLMAHCADLVAPPGYHIAGGTTDRTEVPGGHYVVCLDGELAHDPHPEGDPPGLTGPVEEWFLMLPPKIGE